MINGKCYADGDINEDDDKFECSAEVSQNAWTLKGGQSSIFD